MGYAITKASRAFRTLSASKATVGSPSPLAVTSTSLGSGLFLTDRGWRILPAWLFSLSGVQNPAKILAVAPSRTYSAPATKDGVSPAQMSVHIGPGGRRIVAEFVGAASGTGPCTASYTLSVKESEQAVAIAVNAHWARVPPGQACAAVGYQRHASAELRTPLGARVVVNAMPQGAVSVVATS